VFAALALLCVPLAYVAQTLRLLGRIGFGDNAGSRAYAFLQFLLIGPILLIVSIPIDCTVFFINLYTEPPAAKLGTDFVPLAEHDLDMLDECLDLALEEKRHSSLARMGADVFMPKKELSEDYMKKRNNSEVNFESLNKIIQ
jgi:hypothetical protein